MKSFCTLAFAAVFLASPLYALIGEVPTIKAVAAVPTANPSIEAVALVGTTPTGVDQLILRTFRRLDGSFIEQQPIAFVDGTRLVDVTAGPGSISALCANEQILRYPIVFDAFGLPKLIGDTPTIVGPFGHPALDGSATVIAEAPGEIIAIGTTSGRLHIISPRDPGFTVDLGSGPITGLTAVPQVGAFAFAAAHDGHVVGVNVNSGAILFDLADPRPDPLIELSAFAVFEPNDEPLTNPIPVPLLTANGTNQVTTVFIPANPTIGGTLSTGLVVIAAAPIVEVDHGTLFMLTDSGAVLYSDGEATFTIAGAVADLEPDVLNRLSRGKFVTARAECQNNLVDQINTKTLALRYGDSGVVPSAVSVGDADGDGQSDLVAKFSRAEVESMLHGVAAGRVRLLLTWRYFDDSLGFAPADVRVLR